MYADDTTLYCDIHGVPNIQHLLNAELSKINDWLAVNKLSLNVSKTKLMIFHSDKKKVLYPKLTISIELSASYCLLPYTAFPRRLCLGTVFHPPYNIIILGISLCW